MAYTATELRREIYKVLDEVLETGRAVEVERNGRRVRIVPVVSTPPTQRIKPLRDLIVGDPGALEHLDWSGEWNP